MPRFQYVCQNLPNQFLIIFRTFFCVLRTHYFKFIIFLLLACTFNLIPLVTHAAQATLAWDKSMGSVTGYEMHYGTTSGDYDYSVNVGNFRSCTISGLQEGVTYYFAVTAYTDTSDSNYSDEIAYTIPSSGGGPFDTFKPGADWCRDFGPCSEGQGDCDGDAECQSGLICAQDVGANYGWPANRDVCESP